VSSGQQLGSEAHGALQAHPARSAFPALLRPAARPGRCGCWRRRTWTGCSLIP